MNSRSPEFADSTTDPAALPDVALTLGDGSPGPVHQATEAPDPLEQAGVLARQLAAACLEVAPAGWQQLNALFALTIGGGFVSVSCTDAEGYATQLDPPMRAVELAREHREISTLLADGPWFRMLVHATPSGALEIELDYGELPFPEDQLFTREAYEEDLRAYPRTKLPVWLAAYLRHDGRQARDPARAATSARARRQPPAPVPGLPDLPTLWARWSVVAAVYVLAESDHGPRILPSIGWFEELTSGGSTLALLPGGRAILSGGTWEAPTLNAAYNQAAPLPDLYAGAPSWVADPLLDLRASQGLLTFCYWWDGTTWSHTNSPTIPENTPALPEIWTPDITADAITSLSAGPHPIPRNQARALLDAADAAQVTRTALSPLASSDNSPAIDTAYHLLTLAGLTLPEDLHSKSSG